MFDLYGKQNRKRVFLTLFTCQTKLVYIRTYSFRQRKESHPIASNHRFTCKDIFPHNETSTKENFFYIECRFFCSNYSPPVEPAIELFLGFFKKVNINFILLVVYTCSQPTHGTKLLCDVFLGFACAG